MSVCLRVPLSRLCLCACDLRANKSHKAAAIRSSVWAQPLPLAVVTIARYVVGVVGDVGIVVACCAVTRVVQKKVNTRVSEARYYGTTVRSV